MLKEPQGKGVGKMPALAALMPEEPAVFPTLNFKGAGSLSYGTDSYGVAQTVNADMNAETLKINTLSFSSPKSQVNDKVSKKTGVTTYTRTQKAKLVDLSNSKKLENASFLLFADKAVKPDGTTFTFDPPFPVYVLPLALNQFGGLDGKTLNYSTQVNGGQFTATLVVSKLSSTGTLVVLRSLLTIPQDQRGELYENFPLPTDAQYSIETSTNPRLIKAINSIGAYYDKDHAKRSNTTMNFKLCSSSQAGNLPGLTFPCD